MARNKLKTRMFTNCALPATLNFGESPDQGGVPLLIRNQTALPSNSSSDSNKENSPPPSSTPGPVLNKILSRRKGKNRKRDSNASAAVSGTEKEREPTKADHPKTDKRSRNTARSKNGKCAIGAEVQIIQHRHLDVWREDKAFVGGNYQPLEELKRLNMSEGMFAQILKDKYSLSKEVMGSLGYPLRPELDIYYKKIDFQRMQGPAYYYHHYYMTSSEKRRLDVHAKEFIPKNDSENSGNESSSSSEKENSSRRQDNANRAPKIAPETIKSKDARSHVCARCGTTFWTTSEQYITQDRCRYHPGKIKIMYGAYGTRNYSCCGQPKGSLGCDSANLHVWAGPTEPIVNSSFVETQPPKSKRRDNNYGVFSLDCEMSYTVTGLEVVKVTVVDISGNPVYNAFVKPSNKIVDFNTRFSGIAAEDFVKNASKSLAQVQQDLKQFISSETVLIGHALENDLKVLKLIHKTVVDTAFTFPHFKGLPYKRSLKSLAQICLNKEIQSDFKGHDSFEDARTCMELILFRLQWDISDNHY